MKRGRQADGRAEETSDHPARNKKGRTDAADFDVEEENFGPPLRNRKTRVILSDDEDEEVIRTNPSTQTRTSVNAAPPPVNAAVIRTNPSTQTRTSVNAAPPPVNAAPPPVNVATPLVNVNGYIEPYPHKMHGDKKDPLYGLFGYHQDLKSAVCLDCGIILHPTHLNHAYNQHYIKLPLHDRSFTHASFNIHVKNYFDSLVIDLAAPRAVYVPGVILPVVSWLQPPVDGFECSFCQNHCTTSLDSLDKHRKKHKTQPGYKEFCALRRNRQGRKCKVQHFGVATAFRFLFPVQPLLSSGGNSRFDAFINELPMNFSLENTLGDHHTSSISTDLPPFLKKVKWDAAIKGYSQRSMRRAVSNPSVDPEDDYHALKPLGNILFSTSFSSIPPAIAEGLTAYRARAKPFEVLNDPTSRSSYGREAVRLVAMLCRRRVAGDSSQDEGKDKNEMADGGDDEDGGEDEGDEDEDEDEGDEDEGDDDEVGNEEGGDEDGNDDSVDEESLDGDYDDVDPDSLDDWEDGLGLVESEPVDDVDEDEPDTQKVISDGKDFHVVFSDAQENSVDNLLKALESCEHEAQDLLDAFTDVILDLFTSHPDDAGLDYLHTPLEAFLISRGLSKDGGFLSSHRMSNTFSMVQYAGLFSILRKCMDSPAPVTTFQKYKEWVDPDRGTPTAFSTIRRYHRLAYQDCRNYVAPPTIQFTERYGTSFTYKGTPMDVDKLAEVAHDAFKQATAILQGDILFGLGKEVLGDVPEVNELDDTSNTTPGYGWLGSSRDDQWRLMQHILNTDAVFSMFFTMLNGVRTLRRFQVFHWLKHITRFKSFVFILIHWAAGMPKRGTEIVKFKIVNLPNRSRNFFWMFGHLAILGLYNKNSSNTGRDHVTLHFLPQAVSSLIFRFYYSVANVERWFVQELYETVDPHWDAYFFSSLGARWDSDQLSKILQEHCKAVMGVDIGLQPFRHIIPAIATHYSIGSKSAEVFSILHDQMGHAADTGFRIYGRIKDGHNQLTNEFCHSSLDFCIEIHKLWGFYDALPSVEASKTYRHLIVDRLSGLETVRLYEEVGSLKDQLRGQAKEIASLKSSVGELMKYVLPSYATHPDSTKTQISSLFVQDIMALLAGAAELSRASSHIVINPTISARLVNWENPESQEAPRKADKGGASSIKQPLSTESPTNSPANGNIDVDELTDLVAQMASPSKKGKGKEIARREEPSPTRHNRTGLYDNMDTESDSDMAAAMAQSERDYAQNTHEGRPGEGEDQQFPEANHHYLDALKNNKGKAKARSEEQSTAQQKGAALCDSMDVDFDLDMAAAVARSKKDAQMPSGGGSSAAHDTHVESGLGESSSGLSLGDPNVNQRFPELDHQDPEASASSQLPPESYFFSICPECGYKAFSLLDVVQHFKEAGVRTHPKSVTGKIGDKKKKFTLQYFRQENMRFECRCCPEDELLTKSDVEDHITLMDRSIHVAAHVAAHLQSKTNTRPDWYNMRPEE